MTNDDDMMIREMAREIYAKMNDRRDTPEKLAAILEGVCDHHDEVVAAEAGIRAGIKLGRSL